MPSAQTFRLKLPGETRPIFVTAIVHYDLGHKVDLLALDGVTRGLDDLPRDLRRWLLDSVIRAAMVQQDIGDTYCPHGRYLVDEFCAACLGEASATP